MEATTVKGLLFELGGQGIDIDLAIGEDGTPRRLTYRSGADVREFAAEEIAANVTDEGTRATVMLATGAADEPIVRLTVIVPAVILGEERSFEVSAAALRTTQRSGFGGPRPGPQQSYEGLTLVGTVASAPADGALGTCRDWYASHDHMPPGPATLRVTGICTFPSTGYSVQLFRHEPQGINPRDLLLDKIVIAPTDIVGPAITDVEVRYEEITDFEYDTVTILPDGPSIPVEEVH